jgi:hypothetical protein
MIERSGQGVAGYSRGTKGIQKPDTVMKRYIDHIRPASKRTLSYVLLSRFCKEASWIKEGKAFSGFIEMRSYINKKDYLK